MLIPRIAAISQSVDLVRAAGAPRAAGLVNGVLRALDRERARPRFPDPAAEPVEYLCSWGSHPRWLVERWLARSGGSVVFNAPLLNRRGRSITLAGSDGRITLPRGTLHLSRNRFLWRGVMHERLTVAHGEPSFWKFETDDDRLIGRVDLPSGGAAMKMSVASFALIREYGTRLTATSSP